MTPRFNSKWSSIQDQFILENFGKMTIADIAKRLGISERTVTYRARRLGIPPRSTKELLENEDFRKAVGKAISKGQRLSGRMCRRYLCDHPDVGSEHRFKAGHENTDEVKAKTADAYRKAVYDELVRMKYGLPRKTKMRLRARQYIDKKKYFKEETKSEE